jgi:hypothetical protein
MAFEILGTSSIDPVTFSLFVLDIISEADKMPELLDGLTDVCPNDVAELTNIIPKNETIPIIENTKILLIWFIFIKGLAFLQ